MLVCEIKACLKKEKFPIGWQASSYFHLQNPLRVYKGTIDGNDERGYFLNVYIEETMTLINPQPIHCYTIDIAKRKFRESFTLRCNRLKWRTE